MFLGNYRYNENINLCWQLTGLRVPTITTTGDLIVTNPDLLDTIIIKCIGPSGVFIHTKSVNPIAGGIVFLTITSADLILWNEPGQWTFTCSDITNPGLYLCPPCTAYWSGAYEALCVASTKGYTSRAVNLQDSYLDIETPNRLFAPFCDPFTGLPDVTGTGGSATIIPMANPAHPRTATVNWVAPVGMWSVSPDLVIGPDAGPWLLILTQTIGGVAQTQYDWFWWGNGVPVMTERLAKNASEQATFANTAAGDANYQAGLAKDQALLATNAANAVLALTRGNNSFDGSTGILTVNNADTPPFSALEQWQCWQDVGKTTKSTSTANINVTSKI